MRRLTVVLLGALVSMNMLADKHEFDFVREAVRLASTPSELLSMPEWMRNDDLCFDYCLNMGYRKEEQYRADTAQVLGRWRQCEKLLDAYHVLLNNPKLMKKLKVSPEAMSVMELSFEDLLNPSYRERFAAMCRYCNNYWDLRHEADAREMPQGRLLRLEYEEHGSSRPNPVYVKIEPDSTGQMTVTVENASRPWTGEMLSAPASDELLTRVRNFVEEQKIHKMVRYHSLPSGFREHPLPTGGPPSWSFSAKFEGGQLSVDNDGWSRFGPADELMNMLNGYVESIRGVTEEDADTRH